MNKQLQVMVVMPILFFALLFVYTKVAGPLPLSVTSVVTQKTDTFTVTGEGKVTVVPDIATVSVGVQSQASTTKQAQDDLNKRTNAVTEAIKKLGIDAKDIKTANYSIYPNYDYQNGKQRITGYQANTTITVKVHELDKTNTVIDTATAQGANVVGGISFDVEDKDKAENSAREEAVAQAKKKADMAAKAAGFKLGKLINYSENSGSQSPVPFLAKAQDAAGRETANTTQVQPGSQDIQITVSMSYQIE